MGKRSGVVLILAGLAVGAYALSGAREPGREIAAAQDAAIAKSGAARSPAVPPGPAAPQAADPAPSPAPAAEAPTQVPAQVPAQGPPSGDPPMPRPLATLALRPPVLVRRLRPAPPTVHVAEAASRVPVGEAKTAAPRAQDPASLAREIQRQLKRIGCYHGDASGVWTPSVRQALKTVTERVNASLPIDRPDPILLAMVQSQQPGACGAACPSGQGRAADGRCLPSALVANAGKLKAPAPGASAAPAGTRIGSGQTAAYRPMEERMDLAGPSSAGTQRRSQTRDQTVAPAARVKTTVQHTRVVARTATARVREHRVARRQPFSGYSGLPSWAIPFMLP